MKNWGVFLVAALGAFSKLQAQISRDIYTNNGFQREGIQRHAYFYGGRVQDAYFKLPNDTTLYHQGVFKGVLSPRLIDSTTFDRLSKSESDFYQRDFAVSRDWQFDWIQVRFMGYSYKTYEQMGVMGRWEFPHQLGGYLISHNDKGIFFSGGAGLCFIPYTDIRNIRVGFSAATSTDFVGEGTGVALLAVPAITAVHNVAGLSQRKVHRMDGEAGGVNFHAWVDTGSIIRNSRFQPKDFPLVIISEGLRDGHVGTRYNNPEFAMMEVEALADNFFNGQLRRIETVILTNSVGEEVKSHKRRSKEMEVPVEGNPNSVGIPTLKK